MRTRWWVPVLIFSLALNVAFLAISGYRFYRYSCVAPSTHVPFPTMNRHLYQTLGLSNSQLKKMEPIAHAFHARLEKLSREMQSKRGLLMNLLSREDVDPGNIEGLRKDMARIQNRIQRAVISHILEVKKILKPEQKERFFQLLHKTIQQEENWFSKNGG